MFGWCEWNICLSIMFSETKLLTLTNIYGKKYWKYTLNINIFKLSTNRRLLVTMTTAAGRKQGSWVLFKSMTTSFNSGLLSSPNFWDPHKKMMQWQRKKWNKCFIRLNNHTLLEPALSSVLLKQLDLVHHETVMTPPQSNQHLNNTQLTINIIILLIKIITKNNLFKS